MIFGVKTTPEHMAKSAVELMSDDQRIAFARDLLLSVLDPVMAPEVMITSHIISRHADALCRDAFEWECG